jgi:hypothetical protein
MFAVQAVSEVPNHHRHLLTLRSSRPFGMANLMVNLIVLLRYGLPKRDTHTICRLQYNVGFQAWMLIHSQFQPINTLEDSSQSVCH